jgi:hypothetical protein
MPSLAKAIANDFVLGQIRSFPDCALTADQVVEFCLGLSRCRDQFHNLRDSLYYKTFLLLGVDLGEEPYWLIPWVLGSYAGSPSRALDDDLIVRPLQRALRGSAGGVHVAVIERDQPWKIIHVAPRYFVSEFHKRWLERHPKASRADSSGDISAMVSYGTPR